MNSRTITDASATVELKLRLPAGLVKDWQEKAKREKKDLMRFIVEAVGSYRPAAILEYREADFPHVR